MSQIRTAALNVELCLMQPGLDIQAQFRVAPGHVCALMGRPGAGKTAVLQSMVGLLPAQGGRVNLGADVLYDPGNRVNLPPEQRQIGWVDGEGLLFNHLTVKGNLQFSWKRCKAPREGLSPDAITDWLGLRPLLELMPEALPPLQRQKVALARALLASPRALVLYQPLKDIPAHEQPEMLDLLSELRVRHPMPIVLVPSRLDDVVRLADEVVLLHEGRVASAGSVSRILSDVSLATFLDGTDAGFVLEGRVKQHDIDWLLTEVLVAGQTVTVPAVMAGEGKPVRLKLRARDVNVHLQPHQEQGVTNELRGRIAQVMLAGEHGSYGAVVVELMQYVDALDPLPGHPEVVWALLTRRSIQQMKLAPGMECHVSFKAMAVTAMARH
jgi:molybdate transport system ATP-binding protein